MKEREIDLLDMIADILSHWRGLLIAIVLGAVLLGAFSYTRSYRNMQNMQNMQSQEAENTSEDEMAIEEKLAQLSENLDDSQLTAVLTTVDDAKEYALKKQYVQDSIYMQLDPMNVAQEELIYNIQEKDENGSQRLGTIYRIISGLELIFAAVIGVIYINVLHTSPSICSGSVKEGKSELQFSV